MNLIPGFTKAWQETIYIEPFVERIEDAIFALGHESPTDYEILAYRIGEELVKRYCHVLEEEEQS